MVDFGGWELPQQYTSIRDEHLAVRNAAGLFDVSHMGRLEVRGAAVEDYLQRLLTNDVASENGRAVYTLMCNEQGGIIDDLIVYRVADDHYNIVVNASNREKDVAWMKEHLPPGLTFEDLTLETCLLAFQGPRAAELLPADGGTDDIGYFAFRSGKVAGRPALLSRTGYTGEDGFEIFVGSELAGEVWDTILERSRPAGALPAGLGARDATRLEAALRLWGNDMDETVNAYEAGLGWTVKLDKPDFVGRAALARVKEEGPRRRLIGLSLQPASIPRHGAAVIAAGKQVGKVTSGTHSFFLGHPIALALVEGPSFRVGETLGVDVRGREAPAEVVKLPFYRGSARVGEMNKRSSNG